MVSRDLGVSKVLGMKAMVAREFLEEDQSFRSESERVSSDRSLGNTEMVS